MPTAGGGGRVGSHDQSIFMHQPPALSRILHLRYVHGFLHRHGNLAFFSGPQQLASHPKSSLSSPCQDPEETSRHRVEARQAQSAQLGPIVHATTRGPSTGYDFDSHAHTLMGAVDCSILLLAWLCIHAHSFLSVIQSQQGGALKPPRDDDTSSRGHQSCAKQSQRSISKQQC